MSHRRHSQADGCFLATFSPRTRQAKMAECIHGAFLLNFLKTSPRFSFLPTTDTFNRLSASLTLAAGGERPGVLQGSCTYPVWFGRWNQIKLTFWVRCMLNRYRKYLFPMPVTALKQCAFFFNLDIQAWRRKWSKESGKRMRRRNVCLLGCIWCGDRSGSSLCLTTGGSSSGGVPEC